KAWNVANYPVISLWQDWDTVLEVKDGIYNSPSCPFVYGGSNCVVTPAQWNSIVTLNRWHLVRMTLYPDKSVKCFIDGSLVSALPASSSSINPGRTSNWILRIGSFDGDIDEVRVSRATRD
ncbi:MAG: hypothetical protein JWM59_4428, partial [Verrucomicrobiales bacterium]|nr:hypothetical protein [Verrucomicrobiales bacterium]